MDRRGDLYCCYGNTRSEECRGNEFGKLCRTTSPAYLASGCAFGDYNAPSILDDLTPFVRRSVCYDADGPMIQKTVDEGPWCGQSLPHGLLKQLNPLLRQHYLIDDRRRLILDRVGLQKV